MRLIAHRGEWLVPEEKNSAVALERAFSHGFGVETDLRDQDGRVVVSHDPARGDLLGLADLLALHADNGPRTPLALNVKVDGLVPLLEDHASGLGSTEHFFFDMSVPDMLTYVTCGLPVFTRRSEIETVAVLAEASAGVWLDAFYSDWVEPHDIAALLDAGLQVCLVSPELHGRERLAWWRRTVLPLAQEEALMLCTDHPAQAAEVLGL